MAQLVPESGQVPPVPGSKTMPFKAIPGLSMGAVRGVICDVLVGVNVTEAEIFCSVMLLGLLSLGKVPIAWSGSPLALIERCVLLHDQVAVAVVFKVMLL